VHGAPGGARLRGTVSVRDPLARVPIRYKLTLTLVGLCVLGFGVGGWFVSMSARDALRDQILSRLGAASHGRAALLDESLRALSARARDFASDGLVRAEAARLVESAAARPPGASLRLDDHLARNKRPIVAAFVDVAVYDDAGRRVAGSAPTAPSPVPAACLAVTEDVVVAGLVPLSGDPDSPGFVLATPLWDLDRTRRLARLVCWARASTWLAGVAPAPVEGEIEGARVLLLDGAGRSLPLDAASAVRPEPADALAHAWPLSAVPGWTVRTEVPARAAFAPVAGLESRFLGAGLIVAAAAALLLFFPMQFVVRPLGALRDAARRVSEGDFAVRVDLPSRDEIGDLARAFNVMTAAVRERTDRLEVSARDLASRKDELARERDRLDAMVRSMQDALVFFDDEGRVLLSNAAAAPLLPVLSGGEGRDLAVRCDAAGAHDGRDCVACLSRGDRPASSCRLEVGSRVYEVRATRIPSTSGWLGRLLVARDITESACFDDRTARQERLAVLGEVAAVVAHELNNPLSAIAMYAQMMDHELPPDSPWRENVDVVRRNTETCSRTIRGLLDWARSGDPEVAQVDLDDVVEDVARFVRPLLKRGGARFERRGAFADPVLTADEVQVRQVLVNLVMNAIQAVEGRGGTVAVEAAEEDDGRTLVLDVVDDGPGVPASRRDRLFEPFFTTKPAGKGTGLGLTISRRLVEGHGGTLVLVSSEPGRTVFRVRLPRAAMVAGRGRPALAAQEGA